MLLGHSHDHAVAQTGKTTVGQQDLVAEEGDTGWSGGAIPALMDEPGAERPRHREQVSGPEELESGLLPDHHPVQQDPVQDDGGESTSGAQELFDRDVATLEDPSWDLQAGEALTLLA